MLRLSPTPVLIATIVGASLLLAGCSSGSKRAGPNEMAVSRAAPLVVPPDYNLVPPAPGEPRPQDVDAAGQALSVMFGGPAQRTPGETANLVAAGGNRAEPGIRSTVGDPKTQTVNKGANTADLINAPDKEGEIARTSPRQP